MKHKNIFYIFDSTPIHHEIHIFKIIYSDYSMISHIYKMNIMQNWSH
jgi:hypothetical protein